MVKLDSSVKEKASELSLGVIQFANLSISDSPKMIKGRIQLFIETLRLEHSTDKLTKIAGIEQWRKAFKKLGTDPSRYRPSSEALLRRLLQGNSFHFVNSAVDINNFLSITHAFPYGLYDLSQINGPVNCRIGTEADSYDGLNGREVHMANKLVLSDQQGAFGSPIVDSTRTCVTESSKDLLQIIFFPPGISLNERDKIVGSTARMMSEINGGEVTGTALVQ
ncbi:B3/B4 domain-containing protein [Brevibacillus daliensis]|uniref:B3/B4 domain-containing protein n=1 Tax=Brevibacillus daliensis TaxID=2892995 RepID=UPI001E48E932|nr:phenylalanine--tRNA ligase beta subunit-related protein [Brevibacillus daliensis]